MMDSKGLIVRVVLLLAALAWAGCSGPSSSTDDELPDSLPFELTRPAVGEPPTGEEIEAFTGKITGFWKQVDYFRWCTWHSHGLHSSYDPDMPDYAVWWQDTRAIKEGDTVTFQHVGGADNLMIRTSKVLSNAISGYLASGDPIMRKIAIDYCKGTVALFQGLVFGSEDPVEPYVTARAIFTHNHSYTTDDGRKVAVDYEPYKSERYDWNAHTVPNPENPFFGSIWVRNMRSKDDLPHMWRVVPLLMRLVQDAEDEEVREAGELALEYLTGFAKDIVDQGYRIRTKESGETYVPDEDLASFVLYDEWIPNAECDPKLTAALLAYGEDLDNDCENGISPTYEAAAAAGNYFNYAIVRYFHLTAITAALILRKDRIAERLLDGLVERADAMAADEEERLDHREWDPDMASYLLASASSGLPLPAAAARIVQEQYSAAVDHYQDWPYWDLWHDSVPDDTYEYKPSRDAAEKKHVRPEEMTYLIEYCYSPWKNPAGVELVDCEIVLDPSRWGE